MAASMSGANECDCSVRNGAVAVDPYRKSMERESRLMLTTTCEVMMLTKPARLRSTLNLGTEVGQDGCTMTLSRVSDTLAAVASEVNGVRTTRMIVGDGWLGCQSAQIETASEGAMSTSAESAPQTAAAGAGSRHTATKKMRVSVKGGMRRTLGMCTEERRCVKATASWQPCRLLMVGVNNTRSVFVHARCKPRMRHECICGASAAEQVPV